MSEDAAFVDANAAAAAIFRKFETKAALANSGVADQPDDPAVAVDRVGEFSLQRGGLIDPADHWGKAPPAPENVAGGCTEQPGDLEDLERCCNSANSLHAQRSHLNELLGGNVGIAGNEDRTDFRHLLHSMGDVDVGSRGVVGLVNGVFDCLDDNLAGMYPHTNLQAGVSQPRDGILHRESGETAANRMVFVRLRRAEQGHDAVALYLVDDAIVAMHGLFHEIERRLKASHSKLRISEAIDQSGRIPDIGEQDREVFAFAPLGAERTQQLLRHCIGANVFPGDWRSTMSAEPAGRPVCVMAGIAFDAEWRAAVFAIVVVRPVQVAALLALHGQSFRAQPLCIVQFYWRDGHRSGGM